MLDEDWVYFRIEPAQMTLVTRIMEGYEYVGVVTALDGKQGIGFVRTTADTAPLAREILKDLPAAAETLTRDEAVALIHGSSLSKK